VRGKKGTGNEEEAGKEGREVFRTTVLSLS